MHPAIVSFFEDTGALELLVQSRWRFPFSVVWFFARPIMRWIGQLVLPRRTARIATELYALDPAVDGRADARAVIRTYASGEPFQVVGYATWERAGIRYMSASFPLPLGSTNGILRLDPLPGDGHFVAVALTSERRGDDAGIWFVVGPLAFRAPLAERLELFAPGMPGAPDVDPELLPGATILGRHEQRLFGIRFVTHRYGFRPRAARRAAPGD